MPVQGPVDAAGKRIVFSIKVSDLPLLSREELRAVEGVRRAVFFCPHHDNASGYSEIAVLTNDRLVTRVESVPFPAHLIGVTAPCWADGCGWEIRPERLRAELQTKADRARQRPAGQQPPRTLRLGIAAVADVRTR